MKSLLGMNLEGLSDWSKSRMFIDVIKTSRQIGSDKEPWTPLNISPNIWPTTDFGITVFTNIKNGWANGVYKLSFDGKADVTQVACPARIINYKYDPSTNKSTADVTFDYNDDTALFLAFRNTGGTVKNVKLFAPGYTNDDQIFTNEFLSGLEPFGGFRFMDYSHINSSNVVKWSDRCLVTDPVWTTDRGGPYEMAIALCNKTGKDGWINIPAKADDDFVYNLAKLIKTTQKPGINWYIEYSNEVWNTSAGFEQSSWNYNQAVAEVTAGDNSLRNLTDYNNMWHAAWRRVAKMTYRNYKIFKEVMGDTSNIRHILATQLAYNGMLAMQLQCLSQYGKVSDIIYGVAGAPYKGVTDNNILAKTDLTLDQLMTNLMVTANLPIDDNEKRINDLAKQYGVKSISYEGGLDISEPDTNRPLKIAAQSDPRVYDHTYKVMTDWFADGGCEYFYYNYTGVWDRYQWGTVQDPRDLTGPKYKALKDIANKYVIKENTVANTKLTGTPFGTPGSWNNTGNTIDKVFDGDMNTFFDSPQADNAFVGIDLGTSTVINSVRFSPRIGQSSRMIGGIFQGSNKSSTDGFVTLGTVTVKPTEGQYTTINFTDTTPYRWVRYVAPVAGYGNISELEFYGTPSPKLSQVKLTIGTVTSIINTTDISIDLTYSDGSTKKLI
jgi:hypothetical protein